MKKNLSCTLLFFILLNHAFAILPTPLLTAPSDSSAGNPANTLINWFNVTGATGYELRLDTSSTLNGSAIQTSTSSQYLTSQLLYGTTYYWQVRAVKTTGTPDSSNWTQVFRFSTINELSLSSPSNGATNQFPKIFLNWSTSGGVTNYQAQLDITSAFNSSNLVDTLVPDSTSDVYINALRFGTIYYWRVRAMHPLDTSLWSQVYTFTTLDSVTQTFPSNTASFLSPSLTLNWDYISGVNNYQVQIDKVATFNSADLQSAIQPDSVSEWTPGNLDFASNYYWRVRTWNAVDTSQWSQTWEFSTLVGLTLNAPANNAVNQNPNVTLNWNFVVAPIWYDTELDTTASFSSPLYLYTTNDTVSEFKTSDLLFGTKYYWRARVHNSVDTSQWSGTYSFTTLVAPLPSYPANGAMTIPSRVTLDWTSVEGTNGYEVKVDTLPNYSSALALFLSPANSSQLLVNLYFGKKYYWSVRTFHSQDTSQWSANWEFTTTDTVTLTSPANNAIDIAPRINLNWSNLNGSNYYLVEYDTSASFSSSIVFSDTVTPSNFIATNLYFNKTYYWHVKAINSVDTSSWSPVWRFKTLNQLVHTSPANGAIGQALLTEINWSGASGASGYIYRFDTSPLFNVAPQIGNSIGTASRADINLNQYGQTYYWQVAIFNAVDTSGWSNPWSFTTLYQLALAPTLLSPFNLATSLPTSAVSLTWNSVASASAYEYAYSSDSGFTNAILGNSTDTFTVIGGLSIFTTYYWRVRAINLNGFSPWSTVFSFTTLNPLTTAPILYAPSDLSVAISSPVNFSWYSISLASTYECEYDSDSLFSSPTTLLANDTNGVSLPLNAFTTYFWRVRGVLANAISPWSQVWRFTTLNSTLPQLIYPMNGDTGLAASVTFNWTLVPVAASYECQYALDSLFTNPILLNSTGDTATSLGLAASTTYYWRVRAYDGTIYYPWSSIWNFTTSFTVDLKSLTTDNQIRFYPNPASETVALVFANPSRSQVRLSLHSIEGSAVWEKEFSGSINEQIDIRSFAKGIYTLKIQSEDRIVFKKLVIQ
jgi:Secretion system C-terminal sorting domain